MARISSSNGAIGTEHKTEAYQIPTAADLTERKVLSTVNKIIDPIIASFTNKNDLLLPARIEQTAKEIKATFQQHFSKMPSDIDVDLCMRILATDTIADCDVNLMQTSSVVSVESEMLFARLAFIIMLTQKLPEYGVGLPNMNYFVLQTIVDQVEPPFVQKLFPLVLESCSRDAIRAYLKRCNQDTKDAFDRHCNNMLRFFNDILRRMQHAAFAGLRGEVRIAIDRMLGFGHQSGLHLLDEFSVPAHHFKSNVTADAATEKTRTVSSKSAAEASATDGAAPAADSKVAELDEKRKFESEAFEAKIQYIRRCFCDSKAISSTLTWRQFSQEWDEIVKRFRDNPIDDTNSFRTWPTPPLEYSSERVLTDNRARLLLCFQFIVYADFWLIANSNDASQSTLAFATTSNVAVPAATKTAAKASAKQAGYVLNEDQKAWFREHSNACYDLIDTYGRRIELPQGGIGAPSSVPSTLPIRQIMQMEAAWNEWKTERGKTVWTRPSSTAGILPVPDSVALAAATLNGDRVAAANQSAASIKPSRVRIDGSGPAKTVQPNNIIQLLRASKLKQTVRVGPEYLNRLWNLPPKNKEQFKEVSYFEPGLEYLVNVLEEADPAAEMEDKYKTVHDANFQFRALRILRKHCSNFISPNMVVQNVGSYLEEIVTKKIYDKVIAEATEKGIKVNAPTLLSINSAPTTTIVASSKLAVDGALPDTAKVNGDGASTTGISDAEDDDDGQLGGGEDDIADGDAAAAAVDGDETTVEQDEPGAAELPMISDAGASLPSAPSTPKRSVEDENDSETSAAKRGKI